MGGLVAAIGRGWRVSLTSTARWFDWLAVLLLALITAINFRSGDTAWGLLTAAAGLLLIGRLVIARRRQGDAP